MGNTTSVEELFSPDKERALKAQWGDNYFEVSYFPNDPTYDSGIDDNVHIETNLPEKEAMKYGKILFKKYEANEDEFEVSPEWPENFKKKFAECARQLRKSGAKVTLKIKTPHEADTKTYAVPVMVK